MSCRLMIAEVGDYTVNDKVDVMSPHTVPDQETTGTLSMQLGTRLVAGPEASATDVAHACDDHIVWRL